jgi:hypothetical protein
MVARPNVEPRLVLESEPTATARVGPPCPVDRVPRQRRNQICIAVIAIGMLNFVVYTLSYAALGGDAPNGGRQLVTDPDGSVSTVYTVRGHFIRTLSGRERPVSRTLWIYSYLHSITVPLTSGAMILSMLVLARPHILATMRGAFVSGATFVTVLGTIVVLVTLFTVVLFAWDFAAQLAHGR